MSFWFVLVLIVFSFSHDNSTISCFFISCLFKLAGVTDLYSHWSLGSLCPARCKTQTRFEGSLTSHLRMLVWQNQCTFRNVKDEVFLKCYRYSMNFNFTEEKCILISALADEGPCSPSTHPWWDHSSPPLTRTKIYQLLIIAVF